MNYARTIDTIVRGFSHQLRTLFASHFLIGFHFILPQYSLPLCLQGVLTGKLKYWSNFNLTRNLTRLSPACAWHAAALFGIGAKIGNLVLKAFPIKGVTLGMRLAENIPEADG